MKKILKEQKITTNKGMQYKQQKGCEYMNRCPNQDCEYHGIDGCYKDITLVECEHCGGLRCLQYTPRITCKDLEAPFNSNCQKVHGKYHNVK